MAELDSTKHNINKTLKFSFVDGIFASGMAGFTQEYYVPFALLLGAKARHVGIINALSNLSSSLMQLKSADLAERARSRKKVVNFFVFFQALALLPVVAIALLGGVNLNIFIAVIVLFTSCGAIATPAWASLMSDLVSPDKRGEYFGWRSRILGFITVIATFIAGFLLHEMKRFNIFYGFAVIFGIAFISRIISWYFLTKMHEPYLEHKKENSFTFFDFLARIKESNFAKFVLFVAVMNFSVNLVSPFFAVLMLKNLSFSYLLFTMITITQTLTSIFLMRRWGMHADKVGNVRIIKFSSYLIAIIPVLWVINRNPIFLFFAQIFSGFSWAAFNLCTLNFIYDAVTPEKRTRCISYFNVFNGIALSLGALLGGFLFQIVPPIFGYRVLTLCLLSALMRLMAGFFISVHIKEVRPVEKITSDGLFFSVIGVRPLF